MKFWKYTGKEVRMLLFLTALFVLCQAASAEEKPSGAAPPVMKSYSSSLREAAGIRIGALKLSANGNMIDMRYRVIDLEKAQKTMSPKSTIYLVDQASGMKLTTPVMAKVGKLRQLPQPSSVNRWQPMLFQNPGRMLKRGSKVTLVIDGLRFEDLVVQ